MLSTEENVKRVIAGAAVSKKAFLIIDTECPLARDVCLVGTWSPSFPERTSWMDGLKQQARWLPPKNGKRQV